VCPVVIVRLFPGLEVPGNSGKSSYLSLSSQNSPRWVQRRPSTWRLRVGERGKRTKCAISRSCTVEARGWLQPSRLGALELSFQRHQIEVNRRQVDEGYLVAGPGVQG
jgi:hypothetical protein